MVCDVGDDFGFAFSVRFSKVWGTRDNLVGFEKCFVTFDKN